MDHDRVTHHRHETRHTYPDAQPLGRQLSILPHVRKLCAVWLTRRSFDLADISAANAVDGVAVTDFTATMSPTVSGVLGEVLLTQIYATLQGLSGGRIVCRLHAGGIEPSAQIVKAPPDDVCREGFPLIHWLK